jgi:hypothetical protein
LNVTNTEPFAAMKGAGLFPLVGLVVLTKVVVQGPSREVEKETGKVEPPLLLLLRMAALVLVRFLCVASAARTGIVGLCPS